MIDSKSFSIALGWLLFFRDEWLGFTGLSACFCDDLIPKKSSSSCRAFCFFFSISLFPK